MYSFYLDKHLRKNSKLLYLSMTLSAGTSLVGASAQSPASGLLVSPTTRYCRRYSNTRALPSYPRRQDRDAPRPVRRDTCNPTGASGNSGNENKNTHGLLNYLSYCIEILLLIQLLINSLQLTPI